jgi:preprotein translocase subunit SecE
LPFRAFTPPAQAEGPAAAMADTPSRKTSPAEFLNQVRTEARKIVWPTREETVKTAIFVFVMMLVLSIFFLGVDSLFGSVVAWLLTLA